MTMTTSTQLPFDQPSPLQLPPRLRELQIEGAIDRVRTAVGDPAWLVVRYPEVRMLLDDDRLGRSHPEPETAARSSDSALSGGPLGNFSTEDADHARMRSLLQPHFAPKHMRALRHRVEALTTGLLDEMAERGSPADLFAALALPLPILVICELLGVPYEDRDEFRGWTNDLGNTADRARSQTAFLTLYTYGQQLVARKRQQPGDDVISRLCASDEVSDDEAAGLAMALLFAGHETTVAQISLGVLLLLANPEQWQTLVDEPGLVSNAVEETLRTARMGAGALARYARTEVEIDGRTIAPGELVLLDVGAANHDPDVFTDPDRFDVTRRAANHLTLGHGAHYCLGAPLARIELETAFSQLVSRFPTLRLAIELEELVVQRNTVTGGLHELPVRWGAAG
ncbi:cytochrome P450 [Mycolicibacterium sp. Dal123E01]|uniref:cytochrome P450 n=1 Tax=Mycolicibacterium sp. Dal123E01 TaxID=3457578 RepID=UPI00403E5B44